MAANANILSLENVSSGYNGATIIHDISFDLDFPGILLIVGPNGSGKSTLLKTIMGFTRIINGNVKYNGILLNRIPPYERARKGISYVFQERRIFSKLTVHENLKIAFIKNGESLKDSLDRVYSKYPILYENRNNNASWLSGGEQQMLAFARVLMQNPKIILFDEPSAGCSPRLTDRIFSDILHMAKNGITCIIVEHRIRESIQISNNLLCLNSGRVSYFGNSKNFKNNHMYIYEYYINRA